MSELPLDAQGSGGGVAPAAAVIEPPRAEKAQVGSGEPMSGAAMWMTGLVLALANFMVVLDLSITNVSVPNIAGSLAVSANEGTWTITSYAVAEAITVPLTGWLASRFGVVRVFVTAMICFGVCSALCGLAPSIGVLVVFRILQGLSGGPMIPLSQTLLMKVFPKRLAGQAMGLWASTSLVGPIAGPILGGLICDNFSWPFIFYINLPVAAACVFFGMRLLKGQETPTRKAKVDVVGVGLLIVWVGALQITLDKGEDLDWFQSPTIVWLSLIAVVGFVAFLIWELTDPDPVVNLKVFKSRNYTISLCVLSLCFGSYFSSVVLVPLWLQTNMNYTATWAGYAVAPSGVLAIIMAPLVGKYMARFDLRLLVFIGVLCLAGVMFWRTGFASNIDFMHIIMPQFAMGFGVPLMFAPIFSLALGTLKPNEVPGGAGLLSFARTMSGAFATSLATSSWSNAARSGRVDLLNQLDTAGALRQIAALKLPEGGDIRQLETLIQGQAVMLATDKLFLVLGVLMVLAAFSVWLMPRVKPEGAASAAH